MKFLKFSLPLLAITILSLTGCGAETEVSSTDGAEEVTVDVSQFTLDQAPEDAQAVAAVRESSQDEDQVVLVGRIGGTTHPWVEGAAAFMMVDEAMLACGDATECNCPTPWDYCCISSDILAANSVTVKFVDEQNKTQMFNAKKAFDLTELQTVIIEGEVDRDDTGKFSILARKMYVTR